MRIVVLLGSLFFLFISCSKEKEYPHYEAFQEKKVETAEAQQITIPIFLAEKMIPEKYENQKKLLKRVESAEVFISENNKDEKFDQELISALEKDHFNPLLYIKSEKEMISFYHKTASQGNDLHDFVLYVNDSTEKVGLNFTTNIHPEELAELLKKIGIHDVRNIKRRKDQIKNILKQY